MRLIDQKPAIGVTRKGGDTVAPPVNLHCSGAAANVDRSADMSERHAVLPASNATRQSRPTADNRRPALHPIDLRLEPRPCLDTAHRTHRRRRSTAPYIAQNRLVAAGKSVQTNQQIIQSANALRTTRRCRLLFHPILNDRSKGGAGFLLVLASVSSPRAQSPQSIANRALVHAEFGRNAADAAAPLCRNLCAHDGLRS